MLRPAVAILALCATQAQAAPCIARDVLVERLGTKYDEHLSGVGLRSKTEVLEVWTSEAGSFTVIVSLASGFACIIATGQDWQSIAAPKEPPT